MSTYRSVSRTRRSAGAALALVLAWLPCAVSAQFFPIQLPREDFIWTWGRQIPEVDDRRFEDLDMQGSEGGFRCELTAKLSPGSRLTESEIRQLENDLRTNLFFIQAVANSMYYLDQSFDLDWAVLDCDKTNSDEDTDEATREEREDKARARAERARERRRAREQND